MYTDTSTSEFIHATQSSVSDKFTEMEMLHSEGFNILIKAKRNGKWWILKGLKESVRNDTEYRELLRKEYDILTMSASSNVVRVKSLEDVEGYGWCIVMEWIDGMTLKEWLSLPHTYKERVGMVKKLAGALAAVHEKQIVHRDLKPSNIMITRNGGSVKLIDFGLSDADDYAVFKQPAGTKGYYSPEQQASSVPDRRNDIYSLGVIMSQMGLGWRWKGIIRRCTGALSRRYMSAEDILKAYQRQCRMAYSSGAAACLLIIACVIIPLRRRTETKEKTDIRYVVHNVPKAVKPIREVLPDTSSYDKLAYNTVPKPRVYLVKPIESERENVVNNLYNSGKDYLDKAVARLNYSQALDTTTSRRSAYMVFVATKNEFRKDYERYIASLPTDINEQERQAVSSQLLDYFVEITEKSLYNKLKERRFK